MVRKIIVIFVGLIVILSSFIVLTNLFLHPSKETEDDQPSDKIPEVDDTGLLINIDYDAIQLNLKKYNESDLDNDTLENDYELEIGTDPRNPDTDGDGLLDNEELEKNTDPTNPDTDRDGLSDFEEIYNYLTNATSPDTDYDELFDGDEILIGTNPLISDSDLDLVPDGQESDFGIDTDNDGFINALDTDSDDDGLLDGQEMYTYGTSMILADTDSDNIDDYDESISYPTEPLDADSDDDGLLDGQEAYDGLWFDASNYLATGAFTYTATDGRILVSSAADTGLMVRNTVTLEPGKYKVIAFAKAMQAIQNPALQIQLSGDVEKIDKFIMPQVSHGVTLANQLRWFSTTPFEIVAESQIDIAIDMVDSGVLDVLSMEKFAIVKYDELGKTITNPLDNDTDDDGLIDGEEAALDAYWFEAEDYPSTTDFIWSQKDASNSNTVSIDSSLPVQYLGDVINVETNLVSSGFYSIFLRGYSPDFSKLDVNIKYIDNSDEIKTIQGIYDMDGLSNRGKWTTIYYDQDNSNFTFYLPSSSSLIIDVSTNDNSENDNFYIDKILVAKLTFSLPGDIVESELGAMVPRLLTDPMDPDTDGDQYRTAGGLAGEDCDQCNSILNITGYLTDKIEMDNGLSPLMIDSDLDLLDDDVDPNPLGIDADDDGLLDLMEDTYPENNPDGEYQPDNETTDWCNPDTDHDRLLDGNEDWDLDGMKDLEETDPANPDTDGDGLLDGSYLSSDARLSNLNHDFTTLIGSEQYNYLSSNLEKINYNGTLYDPWFENNDGTVTFVGEWDVGSPNIGVDWTYTLTKRTSKLDSDSDDDLIIDGEEVFIHGTNPTLKDTDEDGLSDFQEIYYLGTDPLTADHPDLKISSVTIDPSTPEITPGDQSISTKLIFKIKNIGTVKTTSKTCVQYSSTGRTFNAGFPIIEPGQEKEYEIYPICAPQENYVKFRNNYQFTFVFEPGFYTIDFEIKTQDPPDGYSKITESDYSNNDYAFEFTVKGGLPKAYLKCNKDLISRGAPITFSYRGSDVDGEIVEYEIDFQGDGTYDFSNDNAGSVNHTYLESSYNGTEMDSFQPVLRVTDDDGKLGLGYSRDVVVMYAIIDDPDNDGLINEDETKCGSNNMDPDYDNDNLNDYQECMIYKSDPYKADSDDDGLRDDREVIVTGFLGLNTTDDADNDGVINILDADSDNDGLKDGTEFKFRSPDDGNLVEIQIQDINNWYGPSPYHSDTDFDGIGDADEESIGLHGAYGRLHQHMSSVRADTDADGSDDYEEIYFYDTKSEIADTDGDGLEDGVDLQPNMLVKSMSSQYDPIKAEFGLGVNWTKRYPAHMFTSTAHIQLLGMDGNSWELQPLFRDLGNEGVLDSTISSDTIYDIPMGYGDYEIFNMVPLADLTYGSKSFSMYDGMARYYITYRQPVQDFTAHIWNHKFTESLYDTVYTAWEIGLKSGYNNSLEMQFSIADSYDRFDISNENNLQIPAFSYKLYKKGDNGLSISTGDSRYLQCNGDPVYENIVTATHIQDHWYKAELKVPSANIASEEMYILIEPVWIKSETEIECLWPGYLNFASLSKLVYISDDEVIRIGYEEFSHLDYPVEIPSEWDTKIYRNYTSVHKISNDEYVVGDNILEKKIKNYYGGYGRICVSEKNIIVETYTSENIDNLTGEISSSKYSVILEELRSAPGDALLFTDYKVAALKLPNEDLNVKESVWFMETVTGDIAADFYGAITGVDKFDVGGWAINVIVGAGEFIYNLDKFLDAENPLLQRYYAEKMWATGIDTALGFIPYFWIFEIGWKVAIYAIAETIGLPDGVYLETLVDPGALITYWVEYLTPGLIPSDLSRKALTEAYESFKDYVDEQNRNTDDIHYILIPPN